MRLPSQLSPFRSRSFRIYWTGQAVSLVGTWMQQMAQAWVITRLTSSALVLGALAVVGALPIAVLALPAGQLVDRSSRRNVLLATQAVMMLLAVGLAALAASRALALWHLFAFAALLGTAVAFDLPAAQAYAPELVPQEDIPRAVALMQAIFHGSRLIGPALAGLCIARYGEASAFLANGLSFAAVLLSLAAIPVDRPGEGRRAGADRRAGSLTAGVRYAREDPITGALLGMLSLCMLLAFPFVVVLMPYYARYVVAAGAAGMGSIMSASGFGALAGAMTLVAVGGAAWRLRIAIGLLLVSGALVGLGSLRSLGTAVALTATLSLGISSYLGTIMQVVQQRVPGHLRGRVMALFGVGFTAIMPLSGLALSWCADRVGLPRLMIGCGLAFGVLATALVLRLPADEPPPGTAP